MPPLPLSDMGKNRALLCRKNFQCAAAEINGRIETVNFKKTCPKRN
jgi:hypothetical protein